MVHGTYFTSKLWAPGDGSGPPDNLIQAGATMPIAWPPLLLPLFSIMAQLGKPRGHGLIHWPTLKIGARPTIQSRLLEDAADRASLVDALGRGLVLADTAAIRDIATPLYPKRRTLSNPEHLDTIIHKVCDSGYHPCGTVPMGPDSSDDAATNGRGNVRGVEGLTVADASLMPTIPSSNINLPTLMMAERIAVWLSETP